MISIANPLISTGSNNSSSEGHTFTVSTFWKRSKFQSNKLLASFLLTVAALLTLSLPPTLNSDGPFAALMLGASSSWDKSHTTADLTALKLCPQVQPLDLGRHTALYGEVVGLYEDTMYKAWAYESLSQAIRIPYVEHPLYVCVWSNQ